MSCLDEGFESAMTAMILPRGMQRFFRTSNAVERLNKELKRRSQVIGIFPNEESLIRLMGSVLIEQNSLSQSGKVIFKKESYEALLTSDVQEKAFGYCKGTGDDAGRLIRLMPEGNLHTNMDMT